MKRLFLQALCLLCLSHLTGCNSDKTIELPAPNSKWISRIVEYRPAPGQFINTKWGTEAAAQKIVGGRKSLISLGGFGGYIIFEFDHEVYNIDGPDFVIHGNAEEFSSEPGIVMVSPDGRQWFELKGSEYDNPETVHGYQITYSAPSQIDSMENIAWTDNRGESGFLEAGTINKQTYYPVWYTSSELTFTGTLLPGNVIIRNNRYELPAVGPGYVDNFSEDYLQVVGGDSDTRYGNKFDISDAVDATGQPVVLTKIKQIKVYTAMNQNTGAEVGETSTEITGALSLSWDR